MVGVYRKSTFILSFVFTLFVAGVAPAASSSPSSAQNALADADGPWKTPVIRLGFLPGEGAADLKLKGDDLAKMIGKKTGIEVRPYIGTSYSDLIEKIAQKKVDIAFLSALSYVEAESQVGLKVLLKKVWDKGFYYSVILADSRSSIKTLKDLKGKRLAFVDKKSASGYLYPLTALSKAGLRVPEDFKSVVYSGSHDQSVHALKVKATDAIAVFSNDPKGKDSAWTQHQGALKDVRAVWGSAAIPNDPLCVRNDFYEMNPKLTHDFMFGLIELNEDPQLGAEFRRLLGIKSLMTATSGQYEPVREMHRAMISREAK
jgi:phosphonate transport system substrate-binding protein